MTLRGDPLGLGRVLEPKGALPQSAWKLDNTPVCREDELRIDVEWLNIDSASFAQLREASGGDPAAIASHIQSIVAERGKLHNPVTGSGGMLVGTVAEVGPLHPHHGLTQPGERVATLVSLTLTPLWLERIHSVDVRTGQAAVTGEAVLFASGLYARLPADVPLRAALAVLDVCGAPAQTARIVKPGDDVVILGAGGKSGVTVLRQARLSAGDGRVIAVERHAEACRTLRSFGWADAVLELDAARPVEVWEAVSEVLGGRLADVVISCVNTPDAEMAAILCVRDGGVVYFFGMATRFTQAALGAEGVGRDALLVIGNGYCRGHAEHALRLVRETPELTQWFIDKYGEEASV